METMRRGKKQNYNKNFVARKEWMEGKKFGRPKQIWVWDVEPNHSCEGHEVEGVGHWEKV
jgi:hypothetical protein